LLSEARSTKKKAFCEKGAEIFKCIRLQALKKPLSLSPERRKAFQTTADVVKLVDTHVSEACVARHAGSTPAIGTKKPDYKVGLFYWNSVLLLNADLPRRQIWF
jgi:hypothetical protein